MSKAGYYSAPALCKAAVHQHARDGKNSIATITGSDAHSNRNGGDAGHPLMLVEKSQ
jgi:hypothetical protein